MPFGLREAEKAHQEGDDVQCTIEPQEVTPTCVLSHGTRNDWSHDD